MEMLNDFTLSTDSRGMTFLTGSQIGFELLTATLWFSQFFTHLVVYLIPILQTFLIPRLAGYYGTPVKILE